MTIKPTQHIKQQPNNIKHIYTYHAYYTHGGENQEEYNDMRDKLKEYKVYLAAKYRKIHSYKTYYNAAKRFLEYNKYNTITQTRIYEYKAYLNQTKKSSTITGYIAGLDLFLEYLHLHHLRIPIPEPEPIHRNTIRLQQINDICEYARQHCLIQDHLIFLFIRDLDCRVHEIIKAEWSWLNNDEICIQDCKTGNRHGYLTDETQRVLEKHKKNTKYINQKYIFCNQRGDQRLRGQMMSLQGDSIRTLIKKVSRKVVGYSIRPQDLRASIITEEFNHFVNPKYIQKKAGHSNPMTTQIYNHSDDLQFHDYMMNSNIFTRKPVNIRSYIYGFPQDLNKPIWEGSGSEGISFSFTYFLRQILERFYENVFKLWKGESKQSIILHLVS